MENVFEFPISAKKSVSISVKTFFFWRPPDFERKNVEAEKKSVSISVKTFFFFFGDHLILGGKYL